jgi:prenyl protein peptidase
VSRSSFLHRSSLSSRFCNNTCNKGPITEECLFRSAAVPLLLLAGSSLTRVILLSPLVFGLAHLHHFYEFRVTHPDVSLPLAVARSLLQLSYTSLFGIYATFLHLRTGSLLAVIIVHTFCNSMGLPRVWGRFEPVWMTEMEIAGPASRPWTVVYYLLLLSGMAAWYWGLFPLTEDSLALAEF